eukprot:TRINITY_DN19578_c0_g1_i1.p1 TRINITY_DN19578_c0_g1~~TRINITY_DN19578_c0_g1_i1.p1  ORF type:complete len:806 (+),score=105.54 TRINITY_DN19578_c0_g1_i1:84-2420(+)
MGAFMGRDRSRSSLRDSLLENDATQEPRDFEDNKVKITPGWETLQGRAAILTAEEDEEDIGVSGKWIFQRFVNKAMQYVSKVEQGEWYNVDVGLDSVDGIGKVRWVIIIFPFFSFVIFPVLYFSIAILLICGPLFIDNVVFGIVKSDPLRYANLVMACFGYGWMGLAPWMLLIFGNPCDCLPWDHSCGQEAEKTGFVLPCLIIFLPWLSCTATAFSFIQQIFDSALDCQCGIEQDRVRNSAPQYKQAISTIIDKISDPNDPGSFYPTFFDYRTSTWLDRLPIDPKANMLLKVGSVAVGLAPVVWVSMFYNWHAATTIEIAMLVTGSLSITRQFYYFLKTFEEATEQFTEAVDELLILLYVTSHSDLREQAFLKKLWRKTIRGNDAFRKATDKLMGELRSNVEKSIGEVAPEMPTESEEGSESLLDLAQTPSLLNTSIRQKRKLQYVFPELCGIEERGVAINFTTADGVMLYRMVRNWLRLDILNERTGVELFMTVTFPLVVVFAIFVGVQWYHGSFNLSVFIFSFFAFLGLFYLHRNISNCVKANDYLFVLPSKMLFQWEDAYVNGTHGLGQLKDAGWVWNTSKNCVEPLTVFKPPQHLEVTGAEKCSGLFEWEGDMSHDRPVYVQSDGSHFMFAKEQGQWFIAEDTSESLVFSLEDENSFRVLLKNEKTDSAIPPVDGWLLDNSGRFASESAENVFVRETTWRSEAPSQSCENTALLLRHTYKWIEILQEKQTILGLAVTAELQNKVVVGAMSLMAPVASTVFKKLQGPLMKLLTTH